MNARLREALDQLALCLAVALLLVSTKYFVYFSSFFDTSHMPAAETLNWPLDFAAFAFCIASLRIAFGLLARKRHTDASLAEICLTMFLGFGGLVGCIGTCYDGWQSGGSLFLLTGVEAVVVTCLLGLAAAGIIRAGTKLTHHMTKG